MIQPYSQPVLSIKQYQVLKRLFESRTGRALFQGEEAVTAQQLCWIGGGLVGGYDMGGGDFVAMITPTGSLTMTEYIYNPDSPPPTESAIA